ARCPVSTTRNSITHSSTPAGSAPTAIRNSSPRGTSSRTSSATSATATGQSFSREIRGSILRRRARSSDFRRSPRGGFRKLEGKHRSLFGAAGDGEVSAHRLRQLSADREAESGTFVLGGERP